MACNLTRLILWCFGNAETLCFEVIQHLLHAGPVPLCLPRRAIGVSPLVDQGLPDWTHPACRDDDGPAGHRISVLRRLPAQQKGTRGCRLQCHTEHVVLLQRSCPDRLQTPPCSETAAVRCMRRAFNSSKHSLRKHAVMSRLVSRLSKVSHQQCQPAA